MRLIPVVIDPRRGGGVWITHVRIAVRHLARRFTVSNPNIPAEIFVCTTKALEIIAGQCNIFYTMTRTHIKST